MSTASQVATPHALVKTWRERGVGHIRLNRPDARNALSEALRQELREAFHAAEADPEIRVVLLSGEGRNFCAGADIRELAQRDPLEAGWTANRLDIQVESMTKPVIAAMHGPTLGGGIELSLACTLRVVSEDFVGGLPEVKLGAFPASGGTQRLPRIVGEAHALDLMLTGRRFDAKEALALGIACRILPDEGFLAAATEYAEAMATGAPLAMRVIIEATRRASNLSRPEGLDYERRMFGLICGTADMKEGVAAWKEKRQARFAGH